MLCAMLASFAPMCGALREPIGLIAEFVVALCVVALFSLGLSI